MEIRTRAEIMAKIIIVKVWNKYIPADPAYVGYNKGVIETLEWVIGITDDIGDSGQ